MGIACYWLTITQMAEDSPKFWVAPALHTSGYTWWRYKYCFWFFFLQRGWLRINRMWQVFYLCVYLRSFPGSPTFTLFFGALFFENRAKERAFIQVSVQWLKGHRVAGGLAVSCLTVHHGTARVAHVQSTKRAKMTKWWASSQSISLFFCRKMTHLPPSSVCSKRSTIWLHPFQSLNSHYWWSHCTHVTNANIFY